MTGMPRLLLATPVVANHLWLPTANKLGAHAVTGSYIISDYLMTHVSCEVYYGAGGFRRYIFNRFLRIFALYWLVLACTLLALCALPGHFGRISPTIQEPGDAVSWLTNLTLIGLPGQPLALTPPAWSLTMEVVFYLPFGLGFSRGRGIVTA